MALISKQNIFSEPKFVTGSFMNVKQPTDTAVANQTSIDPVLTLK